MKMFESINSLYQGSLKLQDVSDSQIFTEVMYH